MGIMDKFKFLIIIKGMNVYEWEKISDFAADFRAGISIGSFDGIHLGHRTLLKVLVSACKEKNLKSGIITFSRPLPSIKHSDDYDGDLSTLRQRLLGFESLGIDFVVVVDFNEAFAQTTGSDFLLKLKNTFNMKFLAEGIDFRCGYKGATDSQAIKYFCENNNVEYNFVEPVYFDNGGEEERVSSSFIRKMIIKGYFSTVQNLLTKPYQLDFSEINSDGIAEQNKKVIIDRKEVFQVLPKDGVYHLKNAQREDVRMEITNDTLIFTPSDDFVPLLNF